MIEGHLREKDVGYTNAINVKLYGVNFYIHGMKEPDYTTYHFATYGTLERMGPNQSIIYP